MASSAAGIVVCALAMYGLVKFNVFGLPEDDKDAQTALPAVTTDLTDAKASSTATTTQTNVIGPELSANPKTVRLDAPPGEFPSSPSVIRIHGKDGVEQVETGNSTVPFFPTTIRLPKQLVDDGSSPSPYNLQPGDELPSHDEIKNHDEYQLLGLGVRTVSFLSIQVYVVGLYIAKSDIAALQQRLISIAVHPVDGGASPMSAPSNAAAAAATSLVSTERQALEDLLLDPDRGEAAWDAILAEGGLRTVLRLVPTRNTDFLHLRDGWVRGISSRATQRAKLESATLSAGTLSVTDCSSTSSSTSSLMGATSASKPSMLTAIPALVPAPQSTVPLTSFQDESFGVSINQFKTLFSGSGNGRRSVPKGQVLMLMRGPDGALDALLQRDPQHGIRWLGRVLDERVSRLVWLNYLAGKTVASEPARKSIVDGVMGVVERPVGTIVQKVV